MCSQPIVHDAQLLRATLRISARSSAASCGAPANVAAWKLRVGQGADGVEGEQVGQRAQLAVLGRGRAERAGPQVARGREHGRRIRRRDFGGGTHRDGLELLGAQHRAQAAAPGVPPVVGDRGVADATLPGRPDRGHPPAPPEALPQPLLGLRRGQPAQVGGVDQARAVTIDQQHGRPLAGAAHHDRVVAGELAGDREMTGSERVVQHAGQRGLGDNGELGAGGQRGADERGEHEGQRGLPARADRHPAGPGGASARRRARRRRGRPAAARRAAAARWPMPALDVRDERPAEVAAAATMASSWPQSVRPAADFSSAARCRSTSSVTVHLRQILRKANKPP